MSGPTSIKYLVALVFSLGMFLPGASVYSEEMTLEVYETYNMAHRVADAVDGLLKPGETIKVFGNRLIIRASNDTHEKILYVLEEVDRAPKNFLISIRATDQYDAKRSYSSAQVRYVDDNTVIHLGNNKQPEDGVIVYQGSSRDGKIAMRVASKDSLTTRDSKLVQQVRSMEGQRAYIQVGDEIPIRQWIWANGSVIPTTTMDSANTGFYVTPFLSKGQILLDISFEKQQRQNQNQADKDTTRLSTRLRIPLSEWAPLAGNTHGSKEISDGTTYSTQRSGKAQQGIEIKVETIN